jgi:tetratricopeptide (TPR) repeat protein
MNTVDCYRLLELKLGASYAEIKAAYRRLARQLHPDINCRDPDAQTKFIQLTQAYRQLLQHVAPVATPRPAVAMPLSLPPLEQHLKQRSYQVLQNLLKDQKFARAVVLVEGLQARLPIDPEVRQWQAVVYQLWGRYLMRQGQWEKAQRCLHKALKTDPHNRALLTSVERDLQQIQQQMQRPKRWGDRSAAAP